MQEQLPRASACQMTGIGRHVEVERNVVFGAGSAIPHALVVIVRANGCPLPVNGPWTQGKGCLFFLYSNCVKPCFSSIGCCG